MDVLQPPASELAMATTDDLMEFSAEGPTPMNDDDIDIELGDSNDHDPVEDQDMVEDEAADLLDDDEMEDEYAADVPQLLDADVDLDVPSVELLDDIEVNMGSRAPSDIASPMAHTDIPVLEPNLAAAAETFAAAAPTEHEADNDGNGAAIYVNDELESAQVLAQDFAVTEAAEGVPATDEHQDTKDGEQVASAEDEQKGNETALQTLPNTLLESANEYGNQEGDYVEEAAEGDANESHQGPEHNETDHAEPVAAEAAAVQELAPESAVLHAVVIDYQGSKMSLFPSSTEHEGSESFLLEDEALCYEPLSLLMTECRRVLKDDVLDGEEVVLQIPCLGLTVTEAHAESTSITMSSLIDMFLHLSYNDGIEAPEALSTILAVRPKLLARLEFIRTAIADGKGLSHISTGSEAQAISHENSEEINQLQAEAAHADSPAVGFGTRQDEHELQEQIEPQTPAREDPYTHEPENYLDLTTPVKAAKEGQSESDRHEEASGNFTQPTIQETGDTQTKRPSNDQLEVPLEGTIETSIQNDSINNNFSAGDLVDFPDTTSPGPFDADELDADQEVEESSKATEGLTTRDTNNSNEAAEDADEDTLGEDLLADGADSLDVFDWNGDIAAPEDTVQAERDADKAGDQDFTIESDETLGQADASESNTERGDSSANVPASPSSLKRRRSYEDAADLLDDAQTPSPQAKRSRPE